MTTDGDDAFVGLFMVEQPQDWWLPPGFTLRPQPSVPMSAVDPAGNTRFIYAKPGYRPSPRQVDTVATVIGRELGPIPTRGLDPELYRAVGADRRTPLGLLNRAILYPIDRAALLLHLASYGIDASITAATEIPARRGWLDETSAGQLRRDLRLLLIVLGLEAGRAPDLVSSALRRATFRAGAMACTVTGALPPVLLRTERVGGSPSWRTFRIVDRVDADPAVPGMTAPDRTFQGLPRPPARWPGVRHDTSGSL